MTTTACFRFYGELNDFLLSSRRKVTFSHTVKGHPAIKDTLEALGVPHTEIDCILVNGKSVVFSYQLKNGERVAVYPHGDKIRFKAIKHLKARPSRYPKFVIDSHLGKLARHLRLLGFDSIYEKIFPDARIVEVAERENRVILTRDIGLLKNRSVKQGCWLRSTDPAKQLKEVLKKYHLHARIKPFLRCLKCNGRITRIAKHKIIDQLPEKVKEYYKRFYLCRCCQKVYWQGSHYDKLLKLVNKVKSRKN